MRAPRLRISDIKATTVTVPLEAPLRHANGVHEGRFVRTIVEVVTDEGLVGLGEMGGGGESAEAAITGMKAYLLGHDPFQLEALRWKIMNPTASLYNNRTQIHAALEFACMDIIGKATGMRACDLLGGSLREEVPFASYLFYRYANPESGAGGEARPEEMVAHARELVAQHGFSTHKLKGGVFPPEHDLAVLEALVAAFPGHTLPPGPQRELVGGGGYPHRAAAAGDAARLLRGPDLGAGWDGAGARAACRCRRRRTRWWSILSSLPPASG